MNETSMRGITTLLIVLLLVGMGILSHVYAQDSGVNLAKGQRVVVSSTMEGHKPENAVDGIVSDASRWVSAKNKTEAPWIEIYLKETLLLGAGRLYSGQGELDPVEDLNIQFLKDGKWIEIPSAVIAGNKQVELNIPFDVNVEVKTNALRFNFTKTKMNVARVKEIQIFPAGNLSTTKLNENNPAYGTSAHLVAVNQIGFETRGVKRFTSPLSPDGTKFSLRLKGSSANLFSGVIKKNMGEFTTYKPEDIDKEYEIIVEGGTLQSGKSDPFWIRSDFHKEKFWQTAVDFMIDCRSLVGSHPSAYGGCPWRDGTYYSFEVPSLILFYLSNPEIIKKMPIQMNWAKDKAYLLSPDYKYVPQAGGNALTSGKKYYAEVEPPKVNAPDVIQLVHWGLGYYLGCLETSDPSGDPLKSKIHSQTIEQFAFLLYAWPQFKEWLPQSFYDQCHDAAFTHWESAGCLGIDPLWDPTSYVEISDKSLHPYKGRHAPGHSILPNLLMYEVARAEGRTDAARYLEAAVKQAQWIIQTLDWKDPRTTKGQRMSEYKTMTSLVWMLQNYPEQAPAGLKEKIKEWALVAIQRSENMWDFRRYDLGENWTIPKLNETGNLVSFVAAATAASWVVEDPTIKLRLKQLAAAQHDNIFGRNPMMSAAPGYPEKGFAGIERGWPKLYKEDVCARLELCRGTLSSSPGSEMYPFNPGKAFRHPEGWVNYNAGWNVALAYLEIDRQAELKNTKAIFPITIQKKKK